LVSLSALALSVGAASAQTLYCPECAVEKVATCGGFLEGMNVGPDGALWVVDMIGNRILSIGDDGACTERGQGGGRPNGAKFAADGTLIIADGEGLVRFNPADGTLTTVANDFNGEALRELNDLAIDGNGGIYFTAPVGSDLRNPTGRIFYLAPGSGAPVLVQDGLAFPNGIALAPGGQTVFAGEFARAQIMALPTQEAGGLRVSYIHARTSGGIGPDGMTVGPDGKLYAAIFQAGEVAVFDPEGHPLGSIVLPEGAGSFTTNVAVQDRTLYITEASLGEVWRVTLPE
jgi:gluconolactonase